MEMAISGFTVFIDDEDYERIKNIAWWVLDPPKGKRYVCYSSFDNSRSPKKRTIYLHRYILGLGAFRQNPCQVDHINGNTFDCRKSNLRLCTASQNQMNKGKLKNNKSGYKGVSWNKEKNKWSAVIEINDMSILLGRFKDINDAISAYKQGSIKYHGEFGRV